MCGRFFRPDIDWRQYRLALNLIEPDQDPGMEARFNIAPQSDVWVVREAEAGRQLMKMRWGLVPFWWKKPLAEKSFTTFNARGEGLAASRSYREPFKARRCIVPAGGFYEWTGPKGSKRPYAIAATDAEVIGFAGLWDRAETPDGEIVSFTIVTTAANELVAPLHARMPVILDPSDYDAWLNTETPDPEALVRAFPAERMRAWPVSRAVGSVRNEGPELIAPIDDLFGG